MNTYQTREWRELRGRVLARDDHCQLDWVGPCRGALVVHHLDPVADGGPELPDEDGLITLCAVHHPMVHGFLNRQRCRKTCAHRHRTAEARRICEERLNRAA